MTKSAINAEKNRGSTQRTKYQKFLRKTVRRKPCSYILLANIILFLILVAAIVFTLLIIFKSQVAYEKYKNEESILQSRKDEVTFQYCPYEEKPSPFFTDYCHENYGAFAFAWRERKLRKGSNDSTCLDWREQVNCHSDGTGDNAIQITDLTLYRSSSYLQCAGTKGTTLSLSSSQGTPSNDQIIAPAVPNDKLQTGSYVLASQLVIHCPKCGFLTTSFRFRDSGQECYRTFKTDTPGWPSEFKYCDLFGKNSDDTPNSCSSAQSVSIPYPL